MSVEQLYQAAFDQNAREIVQSVISWVPEGLLPESTLKPAEKEALFADYVKFKQNIVAGALNSIYKISHTHSAPHQNIAECVALVTRDPAKASNERWFLGLLHRSRLPGAVAKSRVEHLIDTFCVSKLTLPADLEPIKAACDSALRQKRIDFKQKVRKSYRKTLSENLPTTISEFQKQVVSAVFAALSEDAPEDYTTAFSEIPDGCIKFYKSALLDFVGKQNISKVAFLHQLEFKNDTEDGAIDEGNAGKESDHHDSISNDESEDEAANNTSALQVASPKASKKRKEREKTEESDDTTQKSKKSKKK